ncbi:BTAD domain-containing putative transcriptional regulator [Streptomyces sp. NPDC051940]|uniref:BTAD domain-containing putative transcriptional regulator n=1 Tax=Streptomyces sp. NPDC051940 TaxID=3155675 RepID=UPI00342F9E20
MRYLVLGPTQAVTETGDPVHLGGARLRALLTVLALTPGRTRSAEALIDEVWAAGDPPADATAALQALVGRLRKALGAGAIRSDAAGYALHAAPDDVDLYRFDTLAGEARAALADGNPHKAAALADDALGLWRGPVLADLPDRTGEAARWTSRRLDAQRTRCAAALALGEAPRVIPELAGLVADHPLDEQLHALYLRALRDAGRTAEALAAYEAVRHGLAEQLGADPGPELRALHGELLSGAAVQSGGPPAAAPPRGNLRARLTSFVGREAELDSLGAELLHHRLVTLTGPGGAGKTRLAQEAAARLARGTGRADGARAGTDPDAAVTADGVWVAELAPVEDPAALSAAVLSALGVREAVIRGGAADALRSGDPVERLVEHCATRRLLLVLDNCEHVIAAAAALADRLLADCPGVTILATSREPLAVPGESVRPLAPLPDPVALRLLAERGAAAREGFTPDEDPEACAELCRRLDGLPLAIELAAARLRLLTPRQLVDRLDDRFRLLTSGARTLLPRQQTLRAVVDWSWDLLDTAERAVLRRLSVFAGGCDLTAAEAVCEAPDLPGPEVTELVGALVDKSLVVAEPVAGEMRYRLLETVREYARGRLAEAPADQTATTRRHLTYYRELARTHDPLLRGPRQREILDLLEREHDNIRAALRHAVALPDEHEALSLTLSLGWFWLLRDLRAEARGWATAVSGLAPNPFHEPVEPAQDLAEGLDRLPPPYDGPVLAEARRQVRLLALGNAEGDMAHLRTPEIQRELRGILTAYRPGQPQTCRFPGCLWIYAAMMTGDFERVMTLIEESVATCRRLGWEWELAFALQLRARVLCDRPGGREGAARDADESLALFDRLGDAWGTAEALSSRGESYERGGDFAAAAADFRGAMAYATELGALTQLPMLKSRLGGALVETGDPQEGERLLREAVAEALRQGSEARHFSRIQLAVHCGRTGQTAEARGLFEQLRTDLRQRGPDFFVHMAEGFLAWIDVLDGRYEEALPVLRKAAAGTQDSLAELIAPNVAVVQLITAAWARAGLGDGLTGARLLGAYDALAAQRTGDRPVPVERESRARAEAAVRDSLRGSDGAYESAYAQGRTLGMREASELI